MPTKVFVEVHVVERIERVYMVELTQEQAQLPGEELRVAAEEAIANNPHVPSREVNADIEEVLGITMVDHPYALSLGKSKTKGKTNG